MEPHMRIALFCVLALSFARFTHAQTETVTYMHTDGSGSVRVLTNESAQVVARYDYLPFGELCSPAACGNATSTATTRQCAGKERDAETGQDYFGARYYAGGNGRFTTPDPVRLMSRKRADPQQWNLYAYARNNPLRFNDPRGLYICADSPICDSKKDKEFEKARQRQLTSKDPTVSSQARAYGDPNTDNGVTVNFVNAVPPQCGSDPACTIHGIKPTSDQRSIMPNVNVYFLNSTTGWEFEQQVAHEGSHVEDDLHFVNTYNNARGKFFGAANMTHYETELKAYAVGAIIGKGRTYKIGPSTFSPSDSLNDVYNKIDAVIMDPNGPYRSKADVLIFDPNKLPQD